LKNFFGKKLLKFFFFLENIVEKSFWEKIVENLFFGKKIVEFGPTSALPLPTIDVINSR